MNVKLEKSRICGRVEIPPSKSQAHRVMIASFLAGENFDFGLTGDDVEATKNCLASLKKLFDGEADFAVLDARESGSTLRFLLPIVCALDVNVEIVGHGRLPKRPISELLEVLRAHGAKIVGDELPLKVLSCGAELCLAKGGLSAGVYEIDGGVSSQYVTGLLFALPLLDGDSHIKIDGELVSKNYVEMTLDVLDDFGVKIEKTVDGFFVKGNQKYVASDVKIEGDWSSAAFPLALGLLAGEVETTNLNENSKQADRIFLDLARKMGGDVQKTDGGYIARKSSLIAIEFDAANCPDIVPITAVLCGFSKGVSKIRGVDRLKKKESDRLTAVRELLANLGVKTEYADDTLTIFGGNVNAKNDAKIDGFADHRIAMSGIVAGLAVGGVEVIGVECTSKSYPTFLEDMTIIGAKAQVLYGE
ncbi:MAG: 3-phosphoshikimate 1-carboxyvinyltransferase [Clostridia bacterium]|nr:3-phosphoshikimate 1-carboxyvinyltransferase [Clostridia bacterium]